MLKKIWKIIKILIIACGAVYILSLGIVVFFGQYRRPIQKADAIIILGAAINTPALYNRSLQGLRLYEQGDADVLVLSGGVDYPKSIPEAKYMENVIVAHTSSSPVLYLEDKSQSTFENIGFSKRLIPNAHSVIIVSDNYHLARGVITAKAAGFSPVYWSSPDSSKYYPKGELFYHYLREALALIDYVPKFVFR